MCTRKDILKEFISKCNIYPHGEALLCSSASIFVNNDVNDKIIWSNYLYRAFHWFNNTTEVVSSTGLACCKTPVQI